MILWQGSCRSSLINEPYVQTRPSFDETRTFKTKGSKGSCIYLLSKKDKQFITTVAPSVLCDVTDPGEAFVLLPVGVLQPLHELGVAQQVPVEGAVFGQGQLSGVLRQGGALVVALSDGARESNEPFVQRRNKSITNQGL